MILASIDEERLAAEEDEQLKKRKKSKPRQCKSLRRYRQSCLSCSMANGLVVLVDLCGFRSLGRLSKDWGLYQASRKHSLRVLEKITMERTEAKNKKWRPLLFLHEAKKALGGNWILYWILNGLSSTVVQYDRRALRTGMNMITPKHSFDWNYNLKVTQIWLSLAGKFRTQLGFSNQSAPNTIEYENFQETQRTWGLEWASCGCKIQYAAHFENQLLH